MKKEENNIDQLWEYLSSKKFSTKAALHISQTAGLFLKGRAYERKQIVDLFVHEFKRLGGNYQNSRAELQSAVSVVKKCLSRHEIPFKRISDGVYLYEGYDDLDNNDASVSEPIHVSEINEKADLVPQQDYGEGAHEVYAWYLPKYKGDSSETCFPIKIGRTGAGGFNRRLTDFGSNLPEIPCYLMRLGCKNESRAVEYERMLHHYFRERDKSIKNIIGAEWFNTNSFEIDYAVSVLFPREHKLKNTK